MIDRTQMRAYMAVMIAEMPRRQWLKNMDLFESVFSGAADLIRTERKKPVEALVECVTDVVGKKRAVKLQPFLKAGTDYGETMFKNTSPDEVADWVLEFVRCGWESFSFLSAMEPA